jgi:hypothetical protein
VRQGGRSSLVGAWDLSCSLEFPWCGARRCFRHWSRLVHGFNINPWSSCLYTRWYSWYSAWMGGPARGELPRRLPPAFLRCLELA